MSTAARANQIRRAFNELKAMPGYTGAVILVLGPDALSISIKSELPADAVLELVAQSHAYLRGDRGQASSASKLILPH